MNEVDDLLYEIDLKQCLFILLGKKWLIITIVLVAAIVSYLYSSYIPPVYQAEALLMVDNSSVDFANMTEFPFAQSNKGLTTYSRLFKTNRLLKEVLEEINDESLTVKELQDNIDISILPDTNLINITLKYTEPELAKFMIDKLIDNFIIDNQNLKISASSSARDYVSEQLDKVSSDLEELELAVKEFREETGFVILAETGKRLQERLIELEKDLASTIVEINSRKVSIKYLKENLPEHEEQILTSQNIARNPLIAELKSQLLNKEIQVISLNNIYTEQHPELIKLNAEKRAIKDRLDNQVDKIITSSVYTDDPIYREIVRDLLRLESELLTLEARRDAVQLQLDRQMEDMEKLPEKEMEYSRLERRLQVTGNLYTLLLTRYQELNISEAMEVSDVRIVDPAVIPTKQVAPNKRLNVIIAVLVSLFLSVFIIFVLEFLDSTIKDPEDLELITDVPVIGYIPDFSDTSSEDKK